jgi:hypothetical protein
MKTIQILSTVILLVFGTGTPPVQAAERPAEPLALRIVADIDGSDRMLISGQEVLWIHRHWDWPSRVSINGVPWEPRHTPVLGEELRQSLIPPGVDFSSARMTVHQGRDTVVLHAYSDHVVIHFADTPNGRSTYDLTIHFDGTFDRTFGRTGDAQTQQARRPDGENAPHMGLVGMAVVCEERTNVVIRYESGKVLAPSLLEGPVVPPRQITDGLRITLRGELRLPKELTVRVRHAGGSSTRGIATLSIDSQVIETLGDDRKKVSEQVLELAGGVHSIQWQIEGGDVGHCLLEFADAATGSPLPLFHTQEQLDGLGINAGTRFIDDQSEQTGWPIPQGW